MLASRNIFIAILCVFVLCGLVTYAGLVDVIFGKQPQPHRNFKDVQMPTEIRILLEQRILLTEAAIAAAEPNVDLDMYILLANDAIMLGDLVQAMHAAEKALKGNPINFAAWNLLGTIAEDMYDYEIARLSFQKAVDLHPGIEEYYRDYYNLLLKHWPNDKAEMKRVLDLSVDEVGRSVWSVMALANWYLNAGECQRATDHYEVARALDPVTPGIAEAINNARQTCLVVQ